MTDPADVDLRSSECVPVDESDPLEAVIAAIWRQVLGIAEVGRNDNFFEVGGSSLAAMRLLSEVKAKTGLNISIGRFHRWPTIACILWDAEPVRSILRDRRVETLDGHDSPLVLLEDVVSQHRLFCVHAAGGYLWDYKDIARDVAANGVAVYGFEARGLRSQLEPLSDVGWMASLYITSMRSIQPVGPYHLMGYCVGGLIALEIARYLHASGEAAYVTMLDTALPDPRNGPSERAGRVADYASLLLSIDMSEDDLAGHPESDWPSIIWARYAPGGSEAAEQIGRDILSRSLNVHHATMEAIRNYRAAPYQGPARLYVSTGSNAEATSRRRRGTDGWLPLMPQLRCEVLPESHRTMIQRPYSWRLATRIAASISSPRSWADENDSVEARGG